ncbi:hypothetical protein [Streptomyces sp. SP17KL33]|uniref:hypothetical protein n=1 Tax=Streptomyces sp. SP17KL33 TaxID=3002534 RepID=UPI002E79F68F|nr:hypothetical protein [Streptomyces sp. SP17KL33]MEE1831703.1 hypothetical protein [Streptomyces sp. SP17KL33]
MTTFHDRASTPATLTTRFDRLAASLSCWLRSGAVQNPNGAYSGWQAASGDLSSPYPEITGYMLTFLAHEALDDAERQRADAASRWLASRVEHGDHTCRLDREDGIYLFDIGMITNGLLSYGRRTADRRLLAAGRTAAAYLIEQLGSGPMVGGVRPQGTEPTWSNTGSAHLLKVLQALLSADVHGVPGAAEAAERLAGTVADVRPPTGTAPVETCPGSELVSLHAACYAAEGLWVWSEARGATDARAQATRIVEWVWQQQLSDGGFTTYAHKDGGPIGNRWQSDVLAQAIRLAVLLSVEPDGLPAASDALANSMYHDDGRSAVLYWPQAEDAHSNCWSTMFAYQALCLLSGEPAPTWHELV